MDLTTRMTEVFIQALELDPGTDVTGLCFRKNPKWGSLGHMSLVAAIEDEFGLEIDTDQLIEMDSFAKAVATVEVAMAGIGHG